MNLEIEYHTYHVYMKDPDTLVRYTFVYKAEDANDARGYGMHDHPDLDVVNVVRVS